jgi:tetratricopeptide (TPR) repeat protein
MALQSNTDDSKKISGDAPPDRVISVNVRRQLQQCYERAQKLMEQEPHDYNYAHTMLVDCVTRDPGNLVYVEAFLANLHGKFKNNKRGSMLSFAGKGAFKKALSRQDWPEVLRLGPDVLKANPWDVGTLRGMAEACEAYSLYEAELRYLKNALEAKPKDPVVNRHCAQSLARIGQFDQAIACWYRVDEALGGDQEAQEMIGELQIEKTRGPSRGKRIAQKSAASEEPERQERATPREIELTPRQQLEQLIALNATDMESYFALAELHVEKGRLGEAAHVLTKALAASGNNASVQEKLEDVECLRMKQQIEIAEQRFAKDPADEHRQLIEQLRNGLDRYELDVFDRRSQRLPQDLELKFQLGIRLKRIGNYREAISHFEQSQRLKTRQSGSAFELGECLQRLKQYAKALEYYARSAELAAAADQAALRLLAWYRGAVLAAGLGNAAAAEDLFAKIADQDADYRDAASRLDKLREMRHKG